MSIESSDRLMTRKERVRFAGVLTAIVLATLGAAPAGCQLEPPPRIAETNKPTPPKAGPKKYAGPSDVYARQQDVVERLSAMYPRVEVSAFWQPCGEENSYYLPDKHQVELCTEMEAHPGAAIFFAAHEVGHAITDQLAGTMDEHAADEVGALGLIQLDMRADLMDGAIYHKSEPEQRYVPGDPHPSNGYRAWELMCLADGSEAQPASPECAELYRAKKNEWTRRLSDEHVPPAASEFDINLCHLDDFLGPIITPKIE